MEEIAVIVHNAISAFINSSCHRIPELWEVTL